LQLTTVRFLGVFLDDPADVQSEVVGYVAVQLGLDDTSGSSRYLERSKTAYEHRREISEVFGSGSSPRRRCVMKSSSFYEREHGASRNTRASCLIVLLLGCVASVVARIAPALARRLDELLVVAAVSRWSQLELLRRAPVRSSGPEMVRALDRATTLVDVGAGEVDVSDVPADPWASLARYGLSTKAATLRRMPDEPAGLCDVRTRSFAPGAATTRHLPDRLETLG